ncbi:MAG: NTP transferase domain-containing protein [Alphaproteobacteria bacterium]
MASPSRIAIIPARGGSRRLPRKNVVAFLGRPILAWTVIAAQESGLFDRVVVSTEDDEIASVARDAGAAVADRPAALAGDLATVLDVCLDLLDREEAGGRAWDVVCALYATAPLRNAGDIRAVVELLEPGRCDFAMAVTEYDLPPYRALRQDGDGTLVPMWPDLVARKSQDMPPLVVNNGSTYAVHVPALRQHRTFTGPGCRGHLMPRARSVDIDVAEDLETALWHAQRLGLAAGAPAVG